MEEPRVAAALFKGASAFRSSCAAGIPWRIVFYREMRDVQSGEVLESLYPRSQGVSVETANRRLVSVAGIEVMVHHDYNGSETAPRVVRWADLEPSDGEEPSSLRSTGGNEELEAPLVQPSGPSAAESTASPVNGHTDGRPDTALRTLGRREGLVSTAPSRGASNAERPGDPRVSLPSGATTNARTDDIVVRPPIPSDCPLIRHRLRLAASCASASLRSTLASKLES